MNANITDTIVYIGVDDTDIDLFEGQYEVPDGMAYNSYLIKDEKITIMDTVDSSKADEWIRKLKKALDGKTPEYAVISHVEPDHSGSIAYLLANYPDITLVGNAKTFPMLAQFVDIKDAKTMVVAEGEELDLGNHKLKFVMAPMVHWPEVMVTYDSLDKVLFSADAFGKFGTIDAKDDEGWSCEARRYYFNIVGKYGAPVQTLLKKAKALDIAVICPLHGPVLSENLEYYIGLYDTWSSYKPENKGVLIACASIHGNTMKAVKELEQMLKDAGEERVVVSDLARDDMAEVIEDAFRHDRMILAASSYDGGVFPVMQTFINKLAAKAYQNRTVALIENGSWAPSALRTMKGMLEGFKNITVIEDSVTIKSTLNDESKSAMKKLCDKVIEAGK